MRFIPELATPSESFSNENLETDPQNPGAAKFVSVKTLNSPRQPNIFRFLWIPPTFRALSATEKRFGPTPCPIFSPKKFSPMESIRQKQIGELIRRYFGMLLTEEGSNIYGRDKLVTVTTVKMTPDLLVAKIYISVYGTENKQEVILQLEDNYPRLRQAFASKVGKQMRRVPELEFFLDDTVDEMYRVQGLLDRVRDEDEQLHS